MNDADAAPSTAPKARKRRTTNSKKRTENGLVLGSSSATTTSSLSERIAEKAAEKAAEMSLSSPREEKTDSARRSEPTTMPGKGTPCGPAGVVPTGKGETEGEESSPPLPLLDVQSMSATIACGSKSNNSQPGAFASKLSEMMEASQKRAATVARQQREEEEEEEERREESTTNASPLPPDDDDDYDDDDDDGRSGNKDGKKKRRKKKKKKKSSKEKKRREKIRFVVERGAENASRMGGGNDDADGSCSADLQGLAHLPRTAEVLDLDGLLNFGPPDPNNNGRPTFARSASNTSDAWEETSEFGESFGGSVALPSRKYHDKRQLAEAAKSKFEKGLYCLRKRRYSLARSKFRAALKARILLHEDVRHLSIAPVHEMIGMVERKLKNDGKAGLHLSESLRICEGALERMDREIAAKKKRRERKAVEEGKGGLPSLAEQPSKEEDETDRIGGNASSSKPNTDDNDQRQLLLTNIERIKKTIIVVEKDVRRRKPKQEETKSPPGQDDSRGALSPRSTTDRKASYLGRLSMDSIVEDGEADEQPSRQAGKDPAAPVKTISVDGGGSLTSVSVDREEEGTPPSQDPAPKRPAAELGVRRMSTWSEPNLRGTYKTQRERGEEHYNNESYEMAIACFNDAKFALLIIAGMPERKADGNVVTHVSLRDKINSALLLERITDCQVDKLSAACDQNKYSDEDFSHINYRQAVVMAKETKETLTAEIKSAENAAEIDGLKDLWNQATDSLARIFSKQACVYAKLGNHSRALEIFEDSLATWEEVAEKKVQGNKNNSFGIVAINYNPLILKTQEAISSYYDETKGASKVSHGADSLKNTTQRKALTTALRMVNSHYALGAEAAAGNDSERFKASIHHHLNALKLTRETQQLQGAFDVSLTGSDASPGSRLTTRGQNLVTRRETKEMTENLDEEDFMKQCVMLVAQQEICISHACFRLGLRPLSRRWLSEARSSIEKLGLSDAKEELEVAIYLISVMANIAEATTNSLHRRFSLYDWGLPAFTDGCKEKPRMLLHFAMAALQIGSEEDVRVFFDQALVQTCSAPDRPDYYLEVFSAINAQIIIELKEGNMDGAVKQMKHRLNIVTSWMGSSSLELAKDLHRLACFHSLLGQHEKCANLLEESLDIGSKHDDYDLLDSSKLLATAYDATNHADKAIVKYNLALEMEKNFANKAKMMNALSQLYMKVSGQSHLAIDALEKSLKIQQANVTSDGEDSELKLETMILYGNTMAAQNSFSKAIHWYDLALSSNPDKSPLQSSNLRALYNKGVTLFRSSDMNGARHTFGIIVNEVENNSQVPPGTAFILNAIGNCYYASKDYGGACKQFNKSLSLENEDLSPSTKAGALCNIATAYYKMGNHEKSKDHFKEALRITESSDIIPLGIKASIMCKVAYIFYKQKFYLCAHNMYTEAASIGDGNDLDDEFEIRCIGYAETCRLKLFDQKCSDGVPAQTRGAIARKPRLKSSLIPTSYGHNATTNGVVYSRERKLLAALGVELSDCHLIAFPSKDNKIVCDIALEYLLQQTGDNRAEYELKFEELLGDQMNSKFTTAKSLLDSGRHTSFIDS